MELKDRNTQNPGKIRLLNEDGSVFGTFYLRLDEGATSGGSYCAGTPLNKATLEQLKEDILNAVKNYVAAGSVALAMENLHIYSNDGSHLLTYNGETETSLTLPAPQTGELMFATSAGVYLGTYDGSPKTIIIPTTQTIIQTSRITDSAKNDIY